MPPVTRLPERSSLHFATAAIMARAELLTDPGDWPSAQLIVLSAVLFVAEVLDHL